MTEFKDPATGDRIDWNALKGALLMFKVHEVVHDVNTANGVSDAVRADVTVIDGPLANERYEDALVFSRGLRPQLSPMVGELVLGRLGQGEAKPGQNPPWKLAAPSDADRVAANGWVRAHPEPADDGPF